MTPDSNERAICLTDCLVQNTERDCKGYPTRRVHEIQFLGDLQGAPWDGKLKTQPDVRMLAPEDGTRCTRKR
jgi:hypothetical protein